MDSCFIRITPVRGGRNAVALDLQPQIQVVAERVFDQFGRVGKVPAVLKMPA
jgi:hypothetical protein